MRSEEKTRWNKNARANTNERISKQNGATARYVYGGAKTPITARYHMDVELKPMVAADKSSLCAELTRSFPRYKGTISGGTKREKGQGRGGR